MWIVSAGRSRSTRQPVACLMRPPTSRSIWGDVNGNRLSARRALTRNESTVPVAEIRQDGRGQRAEVVRSATGQGEIRDAEDATQAIANLDP